MLTILYTLPSPYCTEAIRIGLSYEVSCVQVKDLCSYGNAMYLAIMQMSCLISACPVPLFKKNCYVLLFKKSQEVSVFIIIFTDKQVSGGGSFQRN